MADPIVTTATSLEQQAVEVLTALAIIDRAAVAADPTKPDRVNVSVNFDAQTVQYALVLPATIVAADTGFSVEANEIFP